MESSVKKPSGELLRKPYSDDEIKQLFQLGRLWLEVGQIRKAEAVMSGLNEVAPDFAAAWLGTAYLKILSSDYDAATIAAQQALRLSEDSSEAMLYLAACFLTTGDFNSAGTLLGEVGERVDLGKVKNPEAVRFFKMQLARYQSR